MHVLYLTFGSNLKNHTQAHFSICSLMAGNASGTDVHVMTDYPDFYNNLRQNINLLPIDEELLKEWKGPHDFFWRVKIKAIEKICKLYPGEPVLYLDTDTFAYKSIGILESNALKGIAYMHEFEKLLPDAKSKTEKKMWRQIQGKHFGGVFIQSHHAMWNAGVVLFPNQHNGKDCELALAICDDMCKQGVTRRLIEQYALAVALKEGYKLQPADDYIAHYWSNKPQWNSFIEQFFIAAGFQQLSFEQTLNAFKKLVLNKIPVKSEVRNTKSRLQALINSLFPDRNLKYLPAVENS